MIVIFQWKMFWNLLYYIKKKIKIQKILLTGTCRLSTMDYNSTKMYLLEFKLTENNVIEKWIYEN